MNTQMIRAIFMKILMNLIQIRNANYWLYLMKKLNPIVTKLIITVRKLIISLVFITQSYIVVPNNIRLNSTRYFIMGIPNKWELQQRALNHWSEIDYKDFINLYKNERQNHNLFKSFILLLHQLIFYVSERILRI